VTSDYSVVVVGAGPTGLVLANLLGKAGVRTLLVELNGSTVAEPRAVSIDDESLRVVQAMGLLDSVRQDVVLGYGSEYRCPAGHTFLAVHPTAEPYGHPRRNAFQQPVFEARLRHGLDRYPHVETRFGCRLHSFEQDAGGVTIRLHPTDGSQPSTIRADYLLGCDGARSAVRQQLGYCLEGNSLNERWLIVDLESSPVSSRETVVFCNPARPAIALPGPHQTRRYEFKLMASESDAQMLSEECISNLLALHGAAARSVVVRKTVYHFHARIANHWGRGRVWLAGDAAHLSPPFAGQGMNSGVRDAFNVAWKIAMVVQGRIGPGLISSYERERTGHVRSMIGLALRMGAIMGPRTTTQARAIRLFFRILSVWQPARNYFAEMKYKPPARFDGGFLIHSMLSRRGIVGRMLPQPRLRSGPHAGQLLDQLLGEGFALVGIDVDPEVVSAVSFGKNWNSLLDTRVSLTAAEAPELALYAGSLLLLRPDRYVMACFSKSKLRSAVIQLDRLWHQTWQIAEARAVS
jgi:3-(3-hydroxy-phenyl)propionate hydroxylase